MSLKITILFFLIVSAAGCVKIQDSENPESPAPVSKSLPPPEVYEKSALVVDEDLYLWEGEVLNAEQIRHKDTSRKLAALQVYKFDVLELKSGGVLYTLGNDVKIEVADFISDGAIQTFPEGRVAPAGHVGRDGGNIELRLQNPRGYLKAILRGERGGKGADGAPPDEALRGDPGRVYSCAQVERKEHDPSQLLGKQGKRGHPAKDGFRGGNSGGMNIYYPLDADLVFVFEKCPGKGGEGGRGGAGGVRGPAGRACIIQPDERSLSVDYLRGDNGKDGKEGAEGQSQTVCRWWGQQSQCL